MQITKVPAVPTPAYTYTVTGLTAQEIEAVHIAVDELQGYNTRYNLPTGTFEALSEAITEAGF